MQLAESVAVDGTDEAEVFEAEDERFDRIGEVETTHLTLNIVACEGGREFLIYRLQWCESIVHNAISLMLLIGWVEEQLDVRLKILNLQYLVDEKGKVVKVEDLANLTGCIEHVNGGGIVTQIGATLVAK